MYETVNGTVTLLVVVSTAVVMVVTGHQPQDKKFVLSIPEEQYDMERGAVVGIAQAGQWWVTGTPAYCKLVNRGQVQ